MTNYLTAVVADVHGNAPALAACLDYAKARGAAHCLFLGDYVTDHPSPQQVLGLLRQAEGRFRCRFIRGNREDYMIAHQKDPNGWREGSAQGALLHCYENLTAADIAWFASLPIYDQWQLPGTPAVALCHGSPQTAKAPMRGEPGSLEVLAQVGPDLLMKGHSHKQWTLVHRGKRIVCVGSAGNAICRKANWGRPRVTELAGMAQMAFLHLQEGRWAVEFVQVPYPWQETLKILEASDLPQRAPVWAALLRYNVLTGNDPFMVVPTRAQELFALAGGGTVPWPEVPEEFWRRAAVEFGVELY